MKRFAVLLITALLIAGFAPNGTASAQSFCGTTYVVGVGETLSSIAQKCGLSYVVLANINYEISNPNLIRPGQIIRLEAEVPLEQYRQPVSGPAQPYGLQPNGTYIVRRGDSLARIAYLYATTVDALYGANPQLGGRPVVIPGQVLTLPYGARKQKGWVGVSSLAPAAYSSVIVRAVDFPSYAEITFRLYQIETLDQLHAYTLANAGPQDIVRDDDFSIYVNVKTDARGSARVTLRLPNYSYNGDAWVVDVFTNNLGEAETLARSPIMWIGGEVYEED